MCFIHSVLIGRLSCQAALVERARATGDYEAAAANTVVLADVAKQLDALKQEILALN